MVQSREAWMEASVTSCFRGIDKRIVYLRLSPRSTLLYQKQCKIGYPTHMTLGPDPDIRFQSDMQQSVYKTGKKSYSASIRENTGPMALVTTVTANGVNVRYEIIDQSPTTSSFQINEVTGEIRTTYNLDLDFLDKRSPSSVQLQVRAYDPIHQVNATTLVNITVLEANDIPPFCTPAVFVIRIIVYVQDTSPVCNPWYYIKTICSTYSPESQVITLYCTSTNASVSYEIIGGNTNEQFSMRGSTIFTQNAFTYYTPGVVDPTSFELLVRVTVDTAPELSATATVLVQVAYCTTTTTTTTTATTTRTTRIVTVMEYYWAPEPWFVAVMTVTGALLIAVLTLLIWKCFKRSSDLKGLSDMQGDSPPQPDDLLMKKLSMPSLNQQSTKFDGKAEDPVTGQQYLYSSSTGERRWM
ncbi:Cadherin-related family member 4 [Acipenser ruthenus]|uniref:Cadherin-related family member 4 n=1 Tax=Acipenser ruthenus TaxID=7906 RepID=A0A444UNR3_ACIRT|nr:Cadherin-related family member 4 [Acipenser ruthenus]